MDLDVVATRFSMLLENADITFIPSRDEDGVHIMLVIHSFGRHKLHIQLTDEQVEQITDDLIYTLANWSMTLSEMKGE
jgi:hypothetical protein